MSECTSTTSFKGILIGTQTLKRARPCAADVGLASYLERHFAIKNWSTYVYTHVNKCMLQGILYEIGNDVIIRRGDLEHVPMKANIT